jgi:hypothetical protein
LPGALIRRLSAPSSRPSALALIACLIVALELWAAVTHAVHVVRVGLHAAGQPAHTVEAADFDPYALYAMPEALVRAGTVIPPHATYSVVSGSNLSAVQRQRALLAFQLALLPRHFTSDPRKAQWVIAYQMSSEGTGVKYTREIGLGPGVQVVQVAR